MNKTELVASVAEASGMTKSDADKAVNAVIGAITSALANGEQVVLTGFGTFQVNSRAARKGRNPSTGQEIEIAASKAPAFKPGKSLKDAVNA